MKVLKRKGSVQLFDFSKVIRVVTKAFASVEQDLPAKFITELEGYFIKLEEKNGVDYTISTKEINDIIQNAFIKRNYYKVVDSFIRVRQKYDENREKDMKLIKDFAKALAASDIQNQNANMDEASFDGSIGEAASVMLKNDALKYRVNKTTRKNHENNRSYLHDLDALSIGKHNCLSIPFDKLLKEGFAVRQCDVRQAKTFNTASQLLAVIFQVQSLQQFGGVSATHVDWTLVPYLRNSFFKHFEDGLLYLYNTVIKKDDSEFGGDMTEISIEDERYTKWPKAAEYALDMTIKEVNQSIEGLFHNLNTLQSRSGNQLPFTSINYGTCTLPEGRIIIKSFIENAIKGVGKLHETPIFPCCIFQYKKGVNAHPGDPNYDLKLLAIKSNALRLYPNYANCDWSAQKAWKEMDINTKENVIAELSEVELKKLIERCEEHPEIAKQLSIKIIEKEI